MNKMDYKTNSNNDYYSENNRYQTVQTQPDQIVKTPYRASFDNEKYAKSNEKRKYKEDLDYLVDLRRRNEGDGPNFNRGEYGREVDRNIQNLNDKHNFNQYENKNFMKNIMRNYQDEIVTHKDRERLQKQNDLEYDKRNLDLLNYQNMQENQRQLERRIKLKNDQFNNLDQFYQKKQAEVLEKYEDRLSNKRLMDIQTKIQNDRDYQYRNKLNNMNERIYNNGLKFNGYIQNENKYREPFYTKNDYDFNRKVAQLKETEREEIRNDPAPVEERLRELEKYREYENKKKIDKKESQRNYKDYLDFQRGNKNTEKDTRLSQNLYENSDKQLIMPAYHYPNKPIPSYKKANDAIDWVKHNHLETLNNRGRGGYLGDTMLKHNPIVLPLDDMDYNRYLNKERHNILSKSANLNSQNTLTKVGNSIIS